MLPDDLKSYRAPSLFQWIEDLVQEEPVLLLIIFFIISVVADRCGWLV